MTAPIALFVYRRPEHTRRAVQSLLANREASQSPLYIFSDGAASPDHVAAVEAVRSYICDIDGFASVTIVEQPQNLGLANSIVAGVTRLCDEFGRVIVVEDDLVVSEGFLDYMNRGLDRYADDERVMQVAGHSFLRRPFDTRAYFLPLTTSWGWATWARAWEHFDREGHSYADLRENTDRRLQFDLDGVFPYFEMLRAQRANKTDSWAIYWYLSVFSEGGLVVYPPMSLIDNIGMDDSGTHKRLKGLTRGYGSIQLPRVEHFPSPEVDADALSEAKTALRNLQAGENSTASTTLRTIARKTLRLCRRQ